MTKEQLEFYLNRENIFGYNTENDDKTVGWIKVYKRFPMAIFFERHTEIAGQDIYEEQMKIKSKPYRVNIAQVAREIFDCDRDIDNEDYLMNETYSFVTLDDVEVFLKSLGYDLATIKWAVDFEFL